MYTYSLVVNILICSCRNYDSNFSHTLYILRFSLQFKFSSFVHISERGNAKTLYFQCKSEIKYKGVT